MFATIKFKIYLLSMMIKSSKVYDDDDDDDDDDDNDDDAVHKYRSWFVIVRKKQILKVSESAVNITDKALAYLNVKNQNCLFILLSNIPSIFCPSFVLAEQLSSLIFRYFSQNMLASYMIAFIINNW
jgi:hypothetical protein